MDRFAAYDGPDTPSTRPYPLTPSDTDPLPEIPKAIYVGVGGDVVLRGAGINVDVTLRNVPNGYILDIRPSHIRATGTTASGLVALA